MIEILELVKALGPTAGVTVAFLVWVLREKKEMVARIQSTEDFIRGDLMKSNAHQAEVIEANTAALERMGDHCRYKPPQTQTGRGYQGG